MSTLSPSFTQIADNVELVLTSGYRMRGSLHLDPTQDALVLLYADNPYAREVLSLREPSLLDPSVLGHAGAIWVKDYSEMEGLADALVASGLASIVDTATVGRFGARVALMDLTPAPAGAKNG